jgi:hypothetical protein
MPRRLAIAAAWAYNPAMRDDVRGLLDRLLARHRNPWNFTAQVLCLLLLALGLWLHGVALIALALLGLGASLLDFGMPDMTGTGLAPLVPWIERAVAAERRLLERASRLRLGLAGVGLLVLGLVLWTNDLPLIALAVGVIALWRVVRQNKADGIDP